MKVCIRYSSVAMALVIAPVVALKSAGAQPNCAPASRVSAVSAGSRDVSNVMSRKVTLHGREIALRDGLDRLAAAARVKLSYTAEQFDLTRPVCLEYEAVPFGEVLADLIRGASVQPIVVGGDQVVLAPVSNKPVVIAETAPLMKTVELLDRVVVTGSTIGASQRSLPIALDVVNAEQLSQRASNSLSASLDGVVPGLWLWEQSPLSLLARYGSIRGASSFGVSYPKVYVDGIEVANSLLVTHLDPESVARIEVIRGPQGAALYGADAISGVMNIVTRQEGTEGGAPRVQLGTQGGASASDYSANSVLAQNHSLSYRTGTGVRSARLGATLTTIGAFIPDAYSRQLTSNGGLRFVGSRSVVTGTFRYFAQDARTPASPVLSGLNLWPAGMMESKHIRIVPGGLIGGLPGDSAGRRRLDSLSRLVASDSSDLQSVRQYTVGGTASFTQNDRWTHTAVAGFDGYRLKSAAVLDGAFPSAIDSALRAATGSAIRTTLRAGTVGQFGDPYETAATVTFAAEHSFVRDETVTRSAFSPRDQSIAGVAESLVEMRSNAGIIGQVSAGFRESFYLNGGLRVERNTGLDGVSSIATLPMLGAAALHTFGPATIKLRAAYGKGIRPPQTSSRAGTLMGLRGPSAGSALSPEEQSGIEAGADLFIGKFVSLHVTRFDQHASGLIQPVSVYQTPLSDSVARYRRIAYELQNVGEISNRGWELQGSIGSGPLSVGATFSNVNSRVEKLAARYTGDLMPGDRMLEVPARTLGVNASYVRPRWSSSWTLSRAIDWVNYDRVALLSAFASQSHSADEFVGQKLRTYWTTYNGVTRIGGRFGFYVGRGMTFTVDGENLLDQQRGEPDNITVLPGRTISAGLKLRF